MSPLKKVLLDGSRFDVKAVINAFSTNTRGIYRGVPLALHYLSPNMEYYWNSANLAGSLNLFYKGGKITICDTQAKDVISGPFSGCLMAKISLGGIDYVTHISASTDSRWDCKYEWFDFLLGNVEYGMNLKAIFRPGYNLRNDGTDKCLGVITSDNECYSIIYNNNNTEIRIFRHFFQCSDLQSYLAKMNEIFINGNQPVNLSDWNRIWDYYNNRLHAIKVRTLR